MGPVVPQVGSMGICLIKVCSSKCTVVKGKYHMYTNMQIHYNTQLVDIHLQKLKKMLRKYYKKIVILSAFCSFYVVILLNLAEPFLENLQKS